jgi:hypothetical protein
LEFGSIREYSTAAARHCTGLAGLSLASRHRHSAKRQAVEPGDFLISPPRGCHPGWQAGRSLGSDSAEAASNLAE